MLEPRALVQIQVQVQALCAQQNTASVIGVAPLSVNSAGAQRSRSSSSSLSQPLTRENEGVDSLILRALHRRSCCSSTFSSNRACCSSPIAASRRRALCRHRLIKTSRAPVQRTRPPGAGHGTHPKSRYGNQQIYHPLRRWLAASASFQRLHTPACNLRDCHQPP